MNDDLQLDVWSQVETHQPRHRLVMLGASNLSRAFPIAVSMAQKVFDAPLAIYVAKGHGRSYGKVSSCLGKKNSGIFSCGIWRAIEHENSMPTTAFVTDIGNDLAYEVPVETIMEWVSASVDRLLAIKAKVVLCDLPLEALRQLNATRYGVFRKLFFPQCTLGWREMLQRAEQLNARLRELAESRDIPVFTVPNQSYGFDPMHPRRRFLPAMWAELLSTVAPTPDNLSRHHCPLALAWYLRGLRPEAWSFFSVSRRASQPHGLLRNGTKIFLY